MGGSALDRAFEDKRNAELDADLDSLMADPTYGTPKPVVETPDAAAVPEMRQAGLEKILEKPISRKAESKPADPYSRADAISSLLAGDFGSYFDKRQVTQEINRLMIERKKNGSALEREDVINLAESNYAARQRAVSAFGAGIPKAAESGLYAFASGITGASAFVGDLTGDTEGAADAREAASGMEKLSEKTLPKSEIAEVQAGWSALRSFAQAAPMMLASWKMKSAEPALAGAFLSGLGTGSIDSAAPVLIEPVTMDSDGKTKELSVAERLSYSVAQGLAERVPEMLPAHILFGSKGGRNLMTTVLQSIATDVPGEQVTLATSKFLEWKVLNPTVPVEKFYETYPQEAYQTFVASLIGTFLNVGAVGALDASSQQIKAGIDKLKSGKAPTDGAPPEGKTPEAEAQPTPDAGAQAADPMAAPAAEAGTEATAEAPQGPTIAQFADAADSALEAMAAEVRGEAEAEAPAMSESQKFLNNINKAFGFPGAAAPADAPPRPSQFGRRTSGR